MSQAITQAFKDAIAEGVFPDAQVLAAKNGEIVYSSHFGNARKDTCFDIASLTKPIATSTLVMFMIAENKLKLSDSVYQWLAGARQPFHRQITVKHLLEHTSGLPAWQPYYREIPSSMIGTEEGKRFILDACYSETLIFSPGEKTLYSDIGFIVLGEMIEQAASATLDELFKKYVTNPLGLKNTFFVRNKSPKSKNEHRRFASTEDCPWRGKTIHGEVHDQNAYALGGVAGHAGLFSTTEDIHVYTKELVKCLRGESEWLPNNIARYSIEFSKSKPSSEEFCFGWNRPSKRSSASGRFFSASSIGHLGYTGCSLWIDIEKDFWITLLTNRINPTSTNHKIKSFRPRIHDLMYNELIKKSSSDLKQLSSSKV